RTSGVYCRGSIARGHGSRRMVYVWRAPRRAAGGLAGDAGGLARLHVEARRVLRPVSSARRAAIARAAHVRRRAPLPVRVVVGRSTRLVAEPGGAAALAALLCGAPTCLPRASASACWSAAATPPRWTGARRRRQADRDPRSRCGSSGDVPRHG